MFSSSTNDRKPVVCGVTSLGMDHVITLGGTQASIAWHKAGIFKVCKTQDLCWLQDTPTELNDRTLGGLV